MSSKEGEGDENNEIPEGFLCPISHVIMQDPYIDSDGNSFEKQEIMDWLSINPISPITRNLIEVSKLVPNRTLRTLIEEWKKNNGDQTVSTASGARLINSAPVVVPLTRKPLILFAVIDNSGSMGESCGTNSSGEDDGYTRLDLVKHTLNTIITSLTEHDKICIIKFSTVAEVFAELTVCSQNNQKILMERLTQLYPENQTNIWDGVRVAVDKVATLNEDRRNDDANIEIYLLTDGEPTINPPGPIVDTVRNYLNRKCPSRIPVIHTFGYGYRLDSTMLFNIAKVGNGIFGFIPDSTMVGTVFINALSHTLISSVAHTTTERNHAAAEGKFGEPTNDEEIFQQLVVRFVSVLEHLLEDVTDKKEVLAKYVDFAQNILVSLEALTPADGAHGSTVFAAAHEKVKAFMRDLTLDCTESKDPNLGQILKATDPTFFQRWGKHYLYSVLSAYQQRMCINFKDKGLQHFKSPQFITEQGRVEEMFVQLPPPKPSRNYSNYYNNYNNHNNYGQQGQQSNAGSNAPAPHPQVNMNNYYDASGGCFSGDSLVCGFGESGAVRLLKVYDIKKGDKVMSLKGETAVECVVRLKYKGNLHSIGATLQLTPYHPVLIRNTAHFPIDFQQPAVATSTNVLHSVVTPINGHVYDFVLENRSILACPLNTTAEGAPADPSAATIVYAATFGHDCKASKFVHPYFGSETVVTDFKTNDPDGYAEGFVELEEYTYVRNEKTSAVQGMKVEHSTGVVPTSASAMIKAEG